MGKVHEGIFYHVFPMHNILLLLYVYSTHFVYVMIECVCLV